MGVFENYKEKPFIGKEFNSSKDETQVFEEIRVLLAPQNMQIKSLRLKSEGVWDYETRKANYVDFPIQELEKFSHIAGHVLYETRYSATQESVLLKDVLPFFKRAFIENSNDKVRELTLCDHKVRKYATGTFMIPFA